MNKIPLKVVYWTDNINAGDGIFGKSLVPMSGLNIWCLSGGSVLIERKGHDDRLVPAHNVSLMIADETVSAEQWSDVLSGKDFDCEPPKRRGRPPKLDK